MMASNMTCVTLDQSVLMLIVLWSLHWQIIRFFLLELHVHAGTPYLSLTLRLLHSMCEPKAMCPLQCQGKMLWRGFHKTHSGSV